MKTNTQSINQVIPVAKTKKKIAPSRILLHIALTIGAIIMVFPFFMDD